MQLTNQVKQSALLAELAYLKLENYEDYENKKYNTLDELLLSGDMKEIGEFISKNPKSITDINDSSDSAMLALLSNYTIVDFKNIPTTISGLNDMQAMLLKKR